MSNNNPYGGGANTAQPATIYNQQRLQAAPSGRVVKEQLIKDFMRQLDNMIANHVTFPNFVGLVTIECYWKGIQNQRKVARVEEHLEGPLDTQTQAQVDAGEVFLEDDSAISQGGIDMRPERLRQQQQPRKPSPQPNQQNSPALPRGIFSEPTRSQPPPAPTPEPAQPTQSTPPEGTSPALNQPPAEMRMQQGNIIDNKNPARFTKKVDDTGLPLIGGGGKAGEIPREAGDVKDAVSQIKTK